MADLNGNKYVEKSTTKCFLDTLPFEPFGRAVALGFFDGLHMGHLEIIRKMVKAGKKNGLVTTVQTFSNSPKGDRGSLTTIEERIDILSELGVDELLVIPFDEDFKNTAPSDFANNILRNKLNAKALFVGEDYSYGKKAEGNSETLKAFGKENGIAVKVIPDKKFEGSSRRISSTWMCEALADGDVELSNRLCEGRAFSYSGTVVKGKQLGRTLGFPTVNIEIAEDKFVLRRGVYAAKVFLGDKILLGVANLGKRPTVEKDVTDVLETYIFDFDEDVYGAKIKVELLKFLRPETKFSSEEELVNAVELNKKQALTYFETNDIVAFKGNGSFWDI